MGIGAFVAVLLFTLLEVAKGENTNITLSILNNSVEAPRHSKEYYVKAFNFMVKSKIFKNFSLADATKYVDDLEDWEPPKELAERFPYYQTGFDYEDRPVWAIEFGKFNVRREVERGPEATANLEKYAQLFCVRVLNSMESKKAIGKDVSEVIAIADWEGLDFVQVAHLPTVSFVLTLFGTYLEILTLAIGQVYCINVSYPAQIALNIARPFLGGIFNKMEIYGSNKAKWSAVLRKILPESAIPTWYGGAKGFKPVQYFG